MGDKLGRLDASDGRFDYGSLRRQRFGFAAEARADSGGHRSDLPQREDLTKINERIDPIIERLKSLGVSVKYDSDDKYKPGYKFAEYELRGVPVRLAIGMRDLENNTVEIARRDTLSKETVAFDGIEETILRLLDEIQTNIYQKASAFRQENTFLVDTWEDFKTQIEKGGFIEAHWDGTPETEEKIKAETKATIQTYSAR
jgi:prolyl-tRNA synthetase